MKKLLIAGRFKQVPLSNGPEMYMQTLFNAKFSEHTVNFVEYSSADQRSGFFRKFFGFSFTNQTHPLFSLGLFPILIHFLIFRPEIVHISGFERFTWLYLLLKKVFKFTIIYTCHGIAVNEDKNKSEVPPTLKKRNRDFEQLLFQKTDHVFVFSSVVPRLFKEHYPAIEQRFVTIRPVLQKLSTYPRNNSDMKNSVLLYAGNELRELSIFHFIRQNAQFFKDLPITIVCAKQQIIDPELHITYLAKMDQEQWFSLLQQHTVFIITYPHETLSFAAFEAMAHGCILIAEKNCGIAEYISHGENGYIFSSEDPESFPTVLAEFVDNSEKQELISIATIRTYNSLTVLSNEHEIEHLYYQELNPTEVN